MRSDKSNGRPKFQAVFCDIDGTLISDSHHILPETLRAIKELDKKGIPFAIASARSPKGILPIMDEGGFRAASIAFSGALIMDKDRRILVKKGMSVKTAAAVIASAKEVGTDIAPSVYTADEWIVENPDDPRNRREAEIVKQYASDRTFEELPEETVIYNILLLTKDKEDGDLLAAHLAAEFPALHITKSWSNYVEATNGEVNKAESVKQLCSIFGVPVENAVAFGDNYNDVEMLEAVGHGVIMANGPEDLKTRIRFVTEDNNHEGIANELKRIGLI